jgi:glutamyl-tRNA synthetase
MRAAQRAAGQPVRYDGRWRDRDPASAPPDVAPVIRLKAPQSGETVLEDLVQGEIKVENTQLDDMVLLRGDGTPTYMLSVVVDDIDMGISHVIRGHDHLTNTFRQLQLYQAIGVGPPRFAHIPLIHGADGAKLSKRHGALSVTEYRELGFLPEAVSNYLLRLGWGHGDDEIISIDQAIAWFDLSGVGRSPARFDVAKLTSLNAHYLRERPDVDLVELIEPRLAATGLTLDAKGRRRLLGGMAGLKQRARTVVDLAEAAAFYVRPRPVPIEEKAQRLLDGPARAAIAAIAQPLAAVEDWQDEALENVCRAQASVLGIGFGRLAQPLRVALTGSTVSPGIFEIMRVLGRSEVLARIEDAATGRNPTMAQSG